MGNGIRHPSGNKPRAALWVHMRSERCVRACRPVRAVCGGMAGAQPTATRPAGSIRCSPIQHQRRHSRLSAPNELAMQLCGTALILLHPYQAHRGARCPRSSDVNHAGHRPRARHLPELAAPPHARPRKQRRGPGLAEPESEMAAAVVSVVSTTRAARERERGREGRNAPEQQ